MHITTGIARYSDITGYYHVYITWYCQVLPGITMDILPGIARYYRVLPCIYYLVLPGITGYYHVYITWYCQVLSMRCSTYTMCLFSAKLSYGNLQDQVLNSNNNAIQRSFLDNVHWNSVPQDILDIAAACQPPILLDYKMIGSHACLQQAFRSRQADYLLGEITNRSFASLVLYELGQRVNVPGQHLYLLSDMKSKSGIYEKLFVRGKTLNDMVRCTFTGPEPDHFYNVLREMLKEEPDLSIQVKKPKEGAVWDVVKIYLFRRDHKVADLFHVPIELQLQNLGATIWYRSSSLHKIYEEQRLAGVEGGFVDEVKDIGEAAYHLNGFVCPVVCIKAGGDGRAAISGPFRVRKGGKWTTVGDLSRKDCDSNQLWIGDRWTTVNCYSDYSHRMMSPYLVHGKLVTGDRQWVWMDLGVFGEGKMKLRIVARMEEDVRDLEFALSFNQEDPIDKRLLNVRVNRDDGSAQYSRRILE
jgi:hypothetical protein